MFKINSSEIYKKTGFKDESLIYYIELGLISPIKYNGEFIYSDEDADRLIMIKNLALLNLRIDQIILISKLEDPFHLTTLSKNEVINVKELLNKCLDKLKKGDNSSLQLRLKRILNNIEKNRF